jgi:hypothetical protein
LEETAPAVHLRGRGGSQMSCAKQNTAWERRQRLYDFIEVISMTTRWRTSLFTI